METIQASLWRYEFERRAAVSEEQRTRLAFELQQRKIRETKKEQEERDERDFAFIQMMVLATESQIAEFTVKLDRYDAATVEALMQNEVDLKAVQERLDHMLMEAHELPTGERVFKTRDGTRVFDQNGRTHPVRTAATDGLLGVLASYLPRKASTPS